MKHFCKRSFDVFNAEISGGTTPFPNFAASGFYFNILEDGATITLAAFDETTNPEIEEGIVEGIQAFTFELVDSPGYTPDPEANSISLTIADTPESQIQVSYFVEPAVLIESEGTVGIHTFEVSAELLAKGIIVTVNAPLEEFDLNAIVVEGGEISAVEADTFLFRIIEESATINLPVANDGEAEGLEEAVFSLQGGDDYEVNPEANGGTFRLVQLSKNNPPVTYDL